jgi:hypothetical protein
VRVRLHQRSRLPELAVTMSLATTVFLFGASFLAPVGAEASARTEWDSAGLIQMRSAVTSEALLPIRKDIRIISLDHDRLGNG